LWHLSALGPGAAEVPGRGEAEETDIKKYPFRGSGNDYQVKYTTAREG